MTGSAHGGYAHIYKSEHVRAIRAGVYADRNLCLVFAGTHLMQSSTMEHDANARETGSMAGSGPSRCNVW